MMMFVVNKCIDFVYVPLNCDNSDVDTSHTQQVEQNF